MTPDELDALEAAARAAEEWASSPWHFDGGFLDTEPHVKDADDCVVAAVTYAYPECPIYLDDDVAHFIAAANPATVLVLIALARKALPHMTATIAPGTFTVDGQTVEMGHTGALTREEAEALGFNIVWKDTPDAPRP